MSQARSPRPLAEQAAHDAVERHWAVAAVPLATRRRARLAADRAWEAVVQPNATNAAPLGRRLTKSEATEIVTVAGAYERAAHEALQAVLAEGIVDGSAARAMLRVAALECFRLSRVLPTDADHAWDLVRITALAVLGDAGVDRGAWADHAERVLRETATGPLAVTLTERRWHDVLQQELPRVWIALLRESALHDLDAPFETLGQLREQRAGAEARQMSELAAADAAHLQLALAGLYGVAEAAAILVTHVRRTMRSDVTDRLDHAFTTARAAVPASTALGRTLPWLQLAATLIARRQSAQIALPGLLT